MLRKILVSVVLLEVLGLFFFHYSSVHASPLEEAERISEACQNTAEQAAHEKCTAHLFADIGEKKGLPFIGQVLSAYQGINTGYKSYQNCHVLAHRIMNDLGSRDPDGWKQLIGQMSAGELDPTRCGGGFMHGVLEVRASSDPAFRVNAALFDEICTESLPKEMSSSCAHILGHLALVESLGVLNEALKACDGLSGDFLFQCYGGIFMEDSMRTNLEVHGLAELPIRNEAWLANQKARCDRYKKDLVVANGCWYDLPEVYAQTHNYDLVKTYAFCNQAPSPEAHDSCYIRASYLIALAPETLFKSFPYKEMCSYYKPGSRELSRCMQDAIGAPLTGSMELIERTISFCEARPESVQSECFDIISGNVRRFSQHDLAGKEALCAKFPEAGRSACLKN